jgi:hypothetical protein
MRTPPKHRSPVDTAAEDIITLSSALSKHQNLENKDKITIARRIGFAIGLDLASKEPSTDNGAIASEIGRLFGKLALETPTLHSWDPIVFVSRPIPARKKETDAASLQAAFAEGVLKGLVCRQENHRTFVRDSIVLKNTRSRPIPESEVERE